MISFIHCGGPGMASYRYRTAIPAMELGAKINDASANILVFSKPIQSDVALANKAKQRGAKIVVDFCDDHMNWPHYQAMLDLADTVICPTAKMADRLHKAVVIPDPYEFDEADPHCNGNNVLWFGNAVNIASLNRVLPDLQDYPLRVVSNVSGAIPWSMETMLYEFGRADIVIIPSTKDYKSPNRALEAIRQGCFVVAEPHPSISELPGIWIGNIKEGIEWATRNILKANKQTKMAQDYIRKKYSPATVGNAWRTTLSALDCT